MIAATSSVPDPARLKAKDIHYLALEGGGGKGFAYLGSLELLDKHKILKQIKGVAGTSAGAITSLMLSVGMTAQEISDEVNAKDFTTFFDAALPRQIPQAGQDYAQRIDDSNEQQRLRAWLSPDALRKFATDLQAGSDKIGPGHLPGWIVWAGIAPLIRGFVDVEQDLENEAANLLTPPFSTLVKDWQHYFTYLDRDMGFFSGLAARQYFDELIALRAVKLLGGQASLYRNMSFRDHKRIFEREFLVCGANLSTGKTVLFSPRDEHTPDFPVADAVRISMSLPVIYKPYVITQAKQGWPPCGTYVDGGLWNNIPLREIEPLPAPQPKLPAWQHAPSSGAGPKWPAKTLALRLEIDPPSRVTSAFSLMTELLNGVAGNGETQVLAEFEYFTVVLDTRDLSMLQFKPDAQTNMKVSKRSRRTICRYFGWTIDPKDVDPQDDQKTAELLAKTICDQ